MAGRFFFAGIMELSPALTFCPTHRIPVLVISPGVGVCTNPDCDYRIEITAIPEDDGGVKISMKSSMSFLAQPSDDYDG